MLAREQQTHSRWGKGNSAPPNVRLTETFVEQSVSRFIGEMPFLWLAVDDEPGPASLRGYIERYTIALLGNYQKPPLDPQSANWLGRNSDRERVRASGLWNSNHVEEHYDPAFLDVLHQLVSKHGVNS